MKNERINMVEVARQACGMPPLPVMEDQDEAAALADKLRRMTAERNAWAAHVKALEARQPARIIIHVRGGVAQVSHASEPVEVLLCDWDGIEAGDGEPEWETVRGSTPAAFEKELREINEQIKEQRA